MPAQQRSLKEIFLDALVVPPSDRAAWLDAACGHDAELRRRAELMLAAHVEPQSLIDQLARADPPLNAATGAIAPRDDDHVEPEKAGTVIGPYKLLQQIGEGGMGVVYMAEQEQPVRRKVALKIIKPGMDTRQVIARFEAERQALAMMDHQNIARVLDAGTTGSPPPPPSPIKGEGEKSSLPPGGGGLGWGGGRPFFVMELVKGIPITKFCDDNHLTPRERLELFVPVCQAIQHAHQKGIIHRDIKPSNVLVTLYDGKPVPKVIDFGVAKAIEQRLTERTLFTQLGQVVGTVEYMSPEQAELNALDIDTRSDIYSLGVLLYELLTGSTPLEKQKLRSAAFTEMLRMIREVEPPKPSTRLSESKDSLASISAQRKTEPAKLAKLVRGELDWIVMKALEKDRGRRYETANGFARDIERYLADEPVEACPPSAGYKLRKFVRKNKRALVTATAFMILLAALGGGAGWMLNDRAARQREADARVSDAEGRVEEALGEAVPLLREGNPGNLALISAAKRVEAQLDSGAVGPDVRERAEQFLRDVRMLAELEQIRLRQAETNSADGDTREDQARFDRSGTGRRYAAAFSQYGLDLATLDPADATARIRASPIREQLVAGLDAWMFVKAPDDPQRARLRQVVDAADDSAWRRAFREAALTLDLQKLKALARQPDALAQPPALLNWVGALLYDMGLFEESADLLRQAQQRHPGDFWINYWLGEDLARVGDTHNDQIGYYRAAVAARPSSAEAHQILGFMLWRRRRDYDAAIVAMQQAIALDPKFTRAYGMLAIVQEEHGNLDEAIACYKKAMELAPKESTGFRAVLAGVLAKKGDKDGALRLLQTSIQMNPKSADTHQRLGMFLEQNMADYDGAVAEYLEAVRLEPNSADAHLTLGNGLIKKGDLEGARREYQASLRITDDLGAPKQARYETDLGAAHSGMWEVLRKTGDLEGARREAEVLVKISPGWAWTYSEIGNDWMAQGKPEEAMADYRKALAMSPKDGYMDKYVAWELATSLDPKLRNPAEALKLAKQAVQRQPQQGAFWQTLGAAHYRAGDWKAAIEALEMSNALLGGNDLRSNTFLLAMAHGQLNQKDLARTWYEKGVQSMEKRKPSVYEPRFRAEAEEVLGIKKEPPKSTPSEKKPEK
jgi:serine/threonine protein kinase/tetratricopeptide (TPR) repeat protein